MERVSLVAVELFRAAPVTSGHTTNALAFSQMMSTMNSAAAVANLHFCAINVHFTPCRLLMTAIARLSSLRQRFLSEIADDTADHSTSERPIDFECLLSKGLNFIHLNTRSLLPKLDDLRILAANGITESWLDASDSAIDITDYTIIRRDRNREGGDVCIYIRSDFIFKLRDDICTTLETVWAELYLPKTKPILIGVCYRPPKHVHFFNTLEQCCLGCNCFTNKKIIMMGDFNIDYS